MAQGLVLFSDLRVLLGAWNMAGPQYISREGKNEYSQSITETQRRWLTLGRWRRASRGEVMSVTYWRMSRHFPYGERGWAFQGERRAGANARRCGTAQYACRVICGASLGKDVRGRGRGWGQWIQSGWQRSAYKGPCELCLVVGFTLRVTGGYWMFVSPWMRRWNLCCRKMTGGGGLGVAGLEGY